MEGTVQNEKKIVGTLSSGGTVVGGMGTVFAKDGITPHIGDNMNWWIGDTDTGVYAKGTVGEKGDPFTYEDLTPAQKESLKGEDGYTPVKGIDYFDGKDGEKGDTGNSGVYVGTEEPTDPNVSVWVNPNGEETSFDTDCHAEYFQVTEDGVISLKPGYRGVAENSAFLDAVSDMGVGVAGSRNAELPKHLVIPEVVDVGGIVEKVAVDRIADGAFYGNKAIKTITFPKTIKEIPTSCFQKCFVENVYNVEQVTTIGKAAFSSSNIKNVNLPSLTSIGAEAFMTCSHLTHANIGSVTEIPADCFYKGYVLSRVESNNKVVSVGHTALHNTPRLANADFVQNLTSIGAGAFIKSGLEYDWSKLQNCTFGNNATALQINPTDFWSACSVTPCENLMPTLLSQKDPRWTSKYIGNSGKKYSGGCLLFCVMHMYCGIHNLHLSTVEEFEEIVEGIKPGHLDTFTNNLLNIPTFVQPLGLTATLIDGFTHDNLQTLYDALAAGKYAIINTSSGATSGSMTGHAIVAYGLTASGKIMFADSSNRYSNDPMAGGGKYALPIYTASANLTGSNPEFCIVEKAV